MSGMTPVGLDLSLTSTGISCMDRQQIISSKHRGPQRLVDISTSIMNFLATVNNPIVIIEGYSFASRAGHAHSIGELGGVVRVALWNATIPYVEVAPTTRAKFGAGRGNAGKNEVISAVSARTGIVWQGSGADDLCDAYLLEEIGLCRIGKPRHSWPALNQSALEGIDWTSMDSVDKPN